MHYLYHCYSSFSSSFKERHIDGAGPDVARRLIEHLCSYVQLVGHEAAIREHDLVLDFESYIALRRETSAMRTAFDLAEYCLDINLLREIYEDPVFVSGYNAALDLVCLSNVWVPFQSGTSRVLT